MPEPIAVPSVEEEAEEEVVAEEVAANPCDSPTITAEEWNEKYNTPSTPWLTYHSDRGEYSIYDPPYSQIAEGYQIDYPSVLERSPDTHSPEVSLYDYSHMIGVTMVDAGLYQNSLDVLLDTFAPTGMRLEKRIQIDGYDALVTSNAPDREDQRDVFGVDFIRGDTLYGIRTQCLDHERVWNSFKFEE